LSVSFRDGSILAGGQIDTTFFSAFVIGLSYDVIRVLRPIVRALSYSEIVMNKWYSFNQQGDIAGQLKSSAGSPVFFFFVCMCIWSTLSLKLWYACTIWQPPVKR